MPAFVPQNETVTLHDATWENWEQVVIKKRMNIADEEWISNQLTGVGTDEQGNPAVQASLGSAKRKTLDRMIVSWTFTDNGQPVPLSAENIARLDKFYADYIYQKINENNQAMPAKAQEDFLRPAELSTSES